MDTDADNERWPPPGWWRAVMIDNGRQAPYVRRPTPRGHSTPGGHRVEIVMPFAHGTRAWLREVCGPGTRPEWDRRRRAWLVARPHFRAVVAALARRYGTCVVDVEHTVRSACGRHCREAEGDECDCSCMGEHHGGQGWRKEWIKVDEEWLVQNVIVRARYRVAADRWPVAGAAR